MHPINARSVSGNLRTKRKSDAQPTSESESADRSTSNLPIPSVNGIELVLG